MSRHKIDGYDRCLVLLVLGLFVLLVVALFIGLDLYLDICQQEAIRQEVVR